MCQPWLLHFYPGAGGPPRMVDLSLSLYASMWFGLPKEDDG